MGILPTLCQLAEVHLSSLALSVPVECLFSTAGLAAINKRSSLSAERLYRICFIHDSFKMISTSYDMWWLLLEMNRSRDFETSGDYRWMQVL